jgi:hypothetical protein
MKSILEVAQELASAHLHEDPNTTGVYLADADDEVRLVEVSSAIAWSGEVLPFRFTARPDQGIDYPSIVILLNPDEWDALKAGKLSLPKGWGTPSSLRKIA